MTITARDIVELTITDENGQHSHKAYRVAQVDVDGTMARLIPPDEDTRDPFWISVKLMHKIDRMLSDDELADWFLARGVRPGKYLDALLAEHSGSTEGEMTERYDQMHGSMA